MRLLADSRAEFEKDPNNTAFTFDVSYLTRSKLHYLWQNLKFIPKSKDKELSDETRHSLGFWKSMISVEHLVLLNNLADHFCVENAELFTDNLISKVITSWSVWNDPNEGYKIEKLSQFQDFAKQFLVEIKVSAPAQPVKDVEELRKLFRESSYPRDSF